ncbi:M3 family oligoendopeptidase [Bradymonas sediminis]|uniref:Oligoendopeptidase n=1 Tax=Bradymonas sediminis TaxID=1548548 RepID=A0A2Z4FKD8_9DELT|nr:M3 family oligoendopeptidase [Bradymonas sediminis]AWV89413.1 oligoendopeptidase [Bradymonas sediminis]TDP73595.1 pepF/M3 family oligoendopeptidase [Bradymonas sediminis]
MSHSNTAAFPVQNPSWELDSIFGGGVDSQAFEDAVQGLERDLGKMLDALESLGAISGGAGLSAQGLDDWAAFLAQLETLSDQAREAGAWAGCMSVTHTDNPRALLLPSRLNDVRARMATLWVGIEAQFRGIEDAVFARFTEHPKLAHCGLFLRELRRDANGKMDPELERLAVELNRDGLHTWGQLYDQISAQIEVEIGEGEDAKKMSVGQASNLFSDADPAKRKRAFEGLQKAWGAQSTTLATTLNAIVGSERTLYTRRGGDELSDALNNNRVERQTIEAMMEAADAFRPLLIDYMQTKSKALGLDEGMAWYDREAPLGKLDNKKISYVEAQEFIVEQAQKFSAPMGEFYRRALANRWVEVEDRPGKAQGGFCTGMPVSKEIRIFMTYGGTASGVQTLAHELGHAYHGWLMRDLGAFERRVPMGLAETASTLSEALVESAALARVEGDQKLRLLDERLQRATAFLINIPARFRLERAMHAERATGELNAEKLTEMTTEIFGKAYGAGLTSVDPTFWASKLHFYITREPFYNFPYTFGYLFSKAVYERAQAEGPSYAGVVDQLLVDTGRLTAEEIGRRYLDADLGDSAFWRAAAQSLHEDVREFKQLLGV